VQTPENNFELVVATSSKIHTAIVDCSFFYNTKLLRQAAGAVI
jgi:hypothetical protein